jgi:hypothetical protein
MLRWLRVERRLLAQSFGIARVGLSFASCVLCLLCSIASSPLKAQDSSDSFHAVPSDAAQVESQESSYGERPQWTVGYSMALGVGEMNDFIGDPSFRGFQVTLLWPAYRALFLGLSFGYNGFYESKSRETFRLDSAAVTAKLYRYANAWPVALLARYQFLQPRSPLRPYLGVGLGAAFIDTTTLVTDLSYDDSSTGFLLAPEAGLLAHLSKAVMLCAAYTFNLTTASMKNGAALSYNTLLLGVSLQP